MIAVTMEEGRREKIVRVDEKKGEGRRAMVEARKEHPAIVSHKLISFFYCMRGHHQLHIEHLFLRGKNAITNNSNAISLLSLLIQPY